MLPQPPAKSSGAPPDPVKPVAVRDQLARILNSGGFRSSPRLCRFLTHIVDRTLEGNADNLKEFSIALEVFDRSTSYDPNVDAIVRVEARRLRAKLNAYYESASDPIRIELRPGSYVPIFRSSEGPAANTGGQDRQTARRPSVAVLPFVNMSSEPEQEYFCDGVSEEIINALAHAPALDVIARTSTFQFKSVAIDIREVGRRLGADLVIEGSVRKAGEQLRITAQAVETESGHHLWSETFHRQLRDVFAIQEEIAQAVARLLQIHAPAHPATARNFDAFAGYLRARFLIHQQTPEALRAALRQLRELVAAFPDYAPGYSGIAAANGFLCLFGAVSGREVYAEVKECAERGYALDPESAETCAVLGGFRSWWEYRWKEGQGLYDRALELQPAHSQAHMLRGMTLLSQGNVDDAEASLRRSMELNPLSASDCARMAYVKYVKGDYTPAAEHLKRAFDLDHDHAEARFCEALLCLRRGDYQQVVRRLSSSEAPLDIGLLTAAHARLGERSAALECLDRLRKLAESQFVTPLGEGLAAIGISDLDLAFGRLGEAIEHRTNFVNLLAVEPFFDPLRRDRRFPKLLKKLRLSE